LLFVIQKIAIPTISRQQRPSAPPGQGHPRKRRASNWSQDRGPSRASPMISLGLRWLARRCFSLTCSSASLECVGPHHAARSGAPNQPGPSPTIPAVPCRSVAPLAFSRCRPCCLSGNAGEILLRRQRRDAPAGPWECGVEIDGWPWVDQGPPRIGPPSLRAFKARPIQGDPCG